MNVSWYEKRIAQLEAELEQARKLPEGYALVPIEPTEKMLSNGYDALMNWDARTGDDMGMYEIYKAMINAAINQAKETA